MAKSRDVVWLDPTPIIERIDSRGGIYVLTEERFDEKDTRRWVRAYHRMRTDGRVSADNADLLCSFLLRVNPALVFGQTWWDSISEPDEVAQHWAEAS